MSEKENPKCPHCGAKMLRWRVPVNSTWTSEFKYVCFNDDCEYYVRGWSWMENQYNVTSSYRCSIDPSNGMVGPLPVWSQDAHKDQIIPDPE